jgi:hypothetical protein
VCYYVNLCGEAEEYGLAGGVVTWGLALKQLKAGVQLHQYGLSWLALMRFPVCQLQVQFCCAGILQSCDTCSSAAVFLAVKKVVGEGCFYLL